jgi:hypothetical protein
VPSAWGVFDPVVRSVSLAVVSGANAFKWNFVLPLKPSTWRGPINEARPYMNQVIISVHVPKAAGTSFAVWLESVFGSGQLVRDYADRPIDPKSEMNVDPTGFLSRHGAARRLPEGARVVHGHFWAKKYERIENAVRITFLRDPIERTISHYYFWRITPGHGHSLHQRVLDEGMGMLDFARLPQMGGFYQDYFFRGVNMAGFDFIGDMSFFDKELGRLEAFAWCPRSSRYGGQESCGRLLIDAGGRSHNWSGTRRVGRDTYR